MRPRKAAYLQITRECNNECAFCSNPQFEKNYTFEEAKKSVDNFKKEGITEIMLTGGEPTIVDFLPQLIKYVKEQGISPKIITNGVKLSEKNLVKKLYGAGLTDVNVSIHSRNEKIADRLSDKPGHFRKALTGIRNALDAGMHITLNSTINSLNCRHLTENVRFFITNFPEIKHYVFNNLDPGKADGSLKSRAGQNPWIVAKLTDMELELHKMVDVLKNNDKTFRIERVPLCYMDGFEEFSTETRKIVKEETYICSFIEKGKKNEVREVAPSQLRTKVGCCRHCKLSSICAGIQQEYLDIHGEGEIFPVFKNPDKIRNKILEN